MAIERRDPFEFLSQLRANDQALTRAVQSRGPRQGAMQRFVGGGGGGQGPANGSVAASQQYARQQLAARGLGDADYQALVNLWNKESNWNPRARNRSSGAYGIAQMMPMHGRREGARAQIDWGINYILKRYGSPSKAWAHSQRTNWY